MPEKTLGLDISSDAVTGVQIKAGLKGHHVTACAHVMIEEAGGLEEALKALVEQVSPEADTCISSIPGEHVSYRNLRMPFKDNKKIRQTLAFELETMLPFPVEGLLIDFTVVERSDQSEILAASVKRSYISEYLAHLQANGIDPAVLDISGISTVGWLLRQEGTPDDGLLLEIGLKRNTMILYLKRHIALVRSFSVGGSVTVSHPEPTTDEQRESRLRWCCTEVQNTLHAVGSHTGTTPRPQAVFVTGSGAVYPDTEDLLNRFLDLPVKRIDLAADPKIHLDEGIAGAWNPAIMDSALALAVRPAKHSLGFNFRRNGFEVKKAYFGHGKEIRKIAAFLALVLCLVGLDLGVDYYSLKKRYNALDRQITDVFRNTLPDVKRIVDPLHQMKVRISEIKKSALSLPGIGGNSKILDLLRDFALRVPESADVHVTRIVIDPDSVLIRGQTDTFNTVDTIKKGLEPSPRFSAVTISSANLDRSGERVQFEMKLERVR